MIIIPQQASKKFSQPNSGDFFGNIKQSKNISFVKNGYISLEKKARLLFDSQTYSDIVAGSGDFICKMVTYGTNYWFAGNKSLYYSDYTLTSLTKDVTSSTPTLSNVGFNDICVFPIAAATNILCVANWSSSVHYYNGSAWATISTDISHCSFMCLFDNLSSLAVGGDNLVQIIDSTKTKSTLLTLPPNYIVKSLDWNNHRLYIGTLETTGGDAMIFEWDGLSTEANYGHPVKGGCISSVVRYKTGVAFATNIGQLLYLEGSIRELANFPIYYNNKPWISASNISQSANYITHGGMVVDKDMIMLAVDASYAAPYGDQTSDYFENDFPSGVWCFDPEVGLEHRYSVDASLKVSTGAVTTSNVNISTNIITIPSAIVPNTGTPVIYDDGSRGAGTWIAPLTAFKKYYVIKLTSTTLQLATTRTNAGAGVYIDLTSTGNNAQFLSFCPNDGFGGINHPARSLLLLYPTMDIQSAGVTQATKILIGSIIKKGDGSLYTGVHTVEFIQENRGYVLSPRIIAKTVLDTFQKIYYKVKPLVTEEDKVITKYRKVKFPLYQNKIYLNSVLATWVTGTTFTTSIITDMVVGYEIEIVDGAGAGYLAHITDISTISAGLYTITIDETVQNISAGQTFNFTVDNWTKLPTILTNQSVNNPAGYAEVSIPEGGRSTAMEFKTEVRGEDVVIEEMNFINPMQQPSL